MTKRKEQKDYTQMKKKYKQAVKTIKNYDL